VLLRKGKDWYVLFIFIFSLMWYIFLYRARKIPIYEKSDFHQRSTPSLSSRHTLIWLPSLCCYTICPYFTDELLDHFSDRFRPLWHTCSHSPLEYTQVPDNWIIFVDYLLVIYLRWTLSV
jgi:hypothetical protein